MVKESWTLLLTFVGTNLLLALLGIPMALGKVPPNYFYGFRTPKTLSSREIWYAANRSMGIELTIAGIVLAIASGVFALTFPSRPDAAAVANIIVVLIALAIVTIRGFMHLRRL